MEETPELVQPPDVASPRSRGAQPGNLNALRHGGRARQERVGFVLAALSERDRSAYVHSRTIRKALELLLLARQDGVITRYQDARIQSLLRLELSCRTVERAMRDDPEMGPADRARYRKLVCDWTLQRDAILFELIGDAPTSPGKPGARPASGVDPWGLVAGEVVEPTS